MPLPLSLLFKYKNSHFVETGSQGGAGIQCAVDAGFNDIRSIEISSIHYNSCSNRFSGVPQVKLYHGDSEKILGEVIASIKAPITFWLDAHEQDDFTATPSHESALMNELETIKAHPVKTHTIMIDDVRCWEKSYALNSSAVVDLVMSINPDYTVVYEYGLVPNDILVAYYAPLSSG